MNLQTQGTQLYLLADAVSPIRLLFCFCNIGDGARKTHDGQAVPLDPSITSETSYHRKLL